MLSMRVIHVKFLLMLLKLACEDEIVDVVNCDVVVDDVVMDDGAYKILDEAVDILDTNDDDVGVFPSESACDIVVNVSAKICAMEAIPALLFPSVMQQFYLQLESLSDQYNLCNASGTSHCSMISINAYFLDNFIKVSIVDFVQCDLFSNTCSIKIDIVPALSYPICVQEMHPFLVNALDFYKQFIFN